MLFEPPLSHLIVTPTTAMKRGEQTVHQCSWCGCVVVVPRAEHPAGPCPACAWPNGGSWWRQVFPVAGLSADETHVHRWGPLGSTICQDCGQSRGSQA